MKIVDETRKEKEECDCSNPSTWSDKCYNCKKIEKVLDVLRKLNPNPNPRLAERKEK